MQGARRAAGWTLGRQAAATRMHALLALLAGLPPTHLKVLQARGQRRGRDEVWVSGRAAFGMH